MTRDDAVALGSGRRRSGLLGLLVLVAVLLVGGGFTALAQGDDDDGNDDPDATEPTVPEPTLTVSLEILDDVAGASWSPRGRITSVVHGGERGGLSATSNEVDAGAAAQAERSLEELGAERTPDGLVLTLPETILFDFDSAELIAGSDEIVDRVAELLVFYDGVEVEVRGHTDSVGDDEYNQRLSEERADAVYGALVGAGAPSAQMEPIGFGATRPVAPNEAPDGQDDPDGRQQNRRVEIVLRES